MNIGLVQRSIAYGISGLFLGGIYSSISKPKVCVDNLCLNEPNIQKDPMICSLLTRIESSITTLDPIGFIRVRKIIESICKLRFKKIVSIQDRAMVVQMQDQLKTSIQRIDTQLINIDSGIESKVVISIQRDLKCLYERVISYVMAIHIATRDLTIA